MHFKRAEGMGTLLSTFTYVWTLSVAHKNIFVAAFFMLASAILSHSIFNQEKQIKHGAAVSGAFINYSQ